MSEDIFRNYYGKNYEKVKAATPIEFRKMKENFRKKYPNATMSKFDFEVTFAKDGTVESRDICFKVDNLTSYDISALGGRMAKRSSGHDFSSEQRF
jgi:hypothetical protein